MDMPGSISNWPRQSSCFPLPQQAFEREMGLESKFVAVSSTFFEKDRNFWKQVDEEAHGAAQESKLTKRPTARRKAASWRRDPQRGAGKQVGEEAHGAAEGSTSQGSKFCAIFFFMLE